MKIYGTVVSKMKTNHQWLLKLKVFLQIVYEINYLHKSLDDFSKICGGLVNSKKLICLQISL